MTITLMDRYITRKLLDYVFLGIVLFTLVLFFSDALLDFMRDLQHYGISWDIAFTLVGLQLPRIVSIVIPMSALLATLMVYNAMSNQFEIIAMRMSGISLYRLALPAVMLGVLATGSGFLLENYIVPTCNKYARGLKTYAIDQQNLPASEQNFTYRQFDDYQQLKRLIYVSHFKDQALGYSTVIDLTNPVTLQVIQARSGYWGKQAIALTDANVYTVSFNQKVSNTTFAHKLNLQHFIAPQKPPKIYKPREMSFFELTGWIKANEKRNGRKMLRDVYVDWWEKLTVPLSSLPLVMIAVPLAMTSPRKMNNMGFLSAIVILFLYYVVRHLCVHSGQVGILPAPLAAVLPLLIILTLALCLFYRKNRLL